MSWELTPRVKKQQFFLRGKPRLWNSSALNIAKLEALLLLDSLFIEIKKRSAIRVFNACRSRKSAVSGRNERGRRHIGGSRARRRCGGEHVGWSGEHWFGSEMSSSSRGSWGGTVPDVHWNVICEISSVGLLWIKKLFEMRFIKWAEKFVFS